MVRDPDALLVCLTKFYGAALILGARNLPRPDSYIVGDPQALTTWLVKLYDEVTR